MPIQRASPPTLTLTFEGLTCFRTLPSEDVLTLPWHYLFPWPDSLLPSPKHPSWHPAIPHHPDQPLPHFRPYSSSFQDSYSKATTKNPTLDSTDIWNYISHSPLKPWNAQFTTNCPHISHKTTSLTLISDHWPLGLSQWLSYSVAPEPHPTHQSSFSLVYLLHLTQSTTESSSPCSQTWHCWLCSNLVHIIPDKSHLSGQMEWLLAKSGNWCPSCLSTRNASVFTIH